MHIEPQTPTYPLTLKAMRCAIWAMAPKGNTLIASTLSGRDDGADEDHAQFLAHAGNCHAELLAACKAIVAYSDVCLTDPLNPCYDDRDTDVIGRHWSGGPACAVCHARAAIDLATA